MYYLSHAVSPQHLDLHLRELLRSYHTALEDACTRLGLESAPFHLQGCLEQYALISPATFLLAVAVLEVGIRRGDVTTFHKYNAAFQEDAAFQEAGGPEAAAARAGAAVRAVRSMGLWAEVQLLADAANLAEKQGVLGTLQRLADLEVQ